MNDKHHRNKLAIRALCQALYHLDKKRVQQVLSDLLSSNANCHFSCPLGDIAGAELYNQIFAPLFSAFPDMERRDVICISGSDQDGAEWVGCAGHYVGRFMAPYLGIPATGHIAHIRFHEFFRFSDGKVQEVQAIWDLPELMLQAGVWQGCNTGGQSPPSHQMQVCPHQQNCTKSNSITNVHPMQPVANTTD